MGTALAQLIAESGREVCLWVFEPELVEAINERHGNPLFLPEIELSPRLRATTSLAEALAGARLVLSVTPSQVLRAVWSKAKDHLHPDAAVVSASKGVEVGTTMLMSEVLDDLFGDAERHRFAFLSGPSFAKEIAARQPTAVVVASTDVNLAQRVQEVMSTPGFRIYTTEDVVGVELGGALKNVIAIAVGVAEGMGLGLNSRAALITRGLAEISRLAVACGANPLTLAGLAGTGDLVLTCTGYLSRNLQVGVRLGKGESLEEILGGMKMVAEGVQTARSSVQLAAKHGVEMPISEVVVKILDGELTPVDAVSELMTRKLKSEREF